MGLFGSIGKAFSGAVKTVAKTVTNPAKLTTAIGTGGLSVVAPKLTKPVTTAVQNTLFNPQLAMKVLSVTPAGKVGNLVAGASLPNVGGSSMGINIGNLLGGVASGFGSLLGGGTPSQALNSFAQFLPSTTSTPFPGSQSPNPYALPTMAAGTAVARAGAVVGRSFFNKFPNLATGIQAWRNAGKQITRAKLYSLMKRFGPDFLISGGILTAAAVSELMMAGPGTRRMNAANSKALRRSLRRLESFDRLCGRVTKQLHRKRRKAHC